MTEQSMAESISEIADLINAVNAVVARWDTPAWKDAEPTAAVIARLRSALSKFSPHEDASEQ